MGKTLAAAGALCLILSAAGNGFAQNNGSVGGSVQDTTKALVPGVTITMTNTETGVASTQLSNESGSYSFASVPAGTYRMTAELPGFKTSVATGVQVGVAAQVRYNFTLEVGAADSKVEISVTTTQLLTESSASIGEVLPDYRVKDLPLVGNNVLDLLEILPGFRRSYFGQASDTVGGMNLNTVNTTINGISTMSTRESATTSGYGVFSPVVINPDLVGEIRLILSPVDAELGNGNSQVQISTRSGTNKYNGSVVWNVANSALNANTWANNNDIVNGVWTPTRPNWLNNNEYTASYGGPIRKNKTFFFVLWDQNIANVRELQQNNVLTDTARQGIFRYFSGWNNGNALTVIPNLPASTTAGTYPVVDFSGNPVAPRSNPNNTPYTGGLYCFSVFGNVKMDGSPFGSADCPGGTAVSNSTGWDNFRPSFDSTGYIQKLLASMPRANYFASGDGLNQAQFRWVRGRGGSNSANAAAGAASSISNSATSGAGDYQNRKSINLKIDQNFNSRNRVSVGWNYQIDDAAANVGAWPGGLSGNLSRRPHLLTVNGTSTLASTLVNEARFGLNFARSNTVPAWLHPNADVAAAASDFLLSGGKNATNGNVYPVVFIPGAGNYQFASHVIQVSPVTQSGNSSPQFSFGDTVSWTRGKHAFKFGVDTRFAHSNGYSIQPFPTVTGGALNTPSPFTDTANFAGQLPGLLAGARGNVANMLYLLSGSVGSASQSYWTENASDLANAAWQDTATRPAGRYREQVMMDWNAFVKDDFKVTRHLTLNLGLRYEYYAPPYLRSGLTSSVVDVGEGLYGAGRPVSGNLFDKWLAPGNLFLTGYGSSAATPLSCQNGVTQSTLLPASTCDPNLMTTIQFIGPNSPNPDGTVFRRDRNNFGPAVGFAWQIPWFGEGKTSLRGGYQVTFQGRTGNLENTLSAGPGGTLTQGLINTDPTINAITATRSLNLTDLPTLVPVTPSRAPGQPIPISARSLGYTAYAPDYSTPYTQNFTLSLTRNLRRNMTLDVRYVGTVAKKLSSSIDLNTVTVFHNKELFEALEITRAGGDAPLFDQMLAGLNLNTTTTALGYGQVGTCAALANAPGGEGCPAGQVRQHGSAHLRRNATFAANLANGNFEAVVASLVTFAPTVTTAGGGQPLPPNLTSTSQRLLRNGCDRLANNLTNIPTRCFPEDYFIANPQFTNATYTANLNSSNYQALQVQYTLRPVQGISFQGTYSWTRLMNQPGGYTDPSDRRADYNVSPNTIPHEFKANGTFEVPVGPNKLFFGNSSGWVARALEKWQTSFTLNLPHGVNRTMNANQMLYAGGTPDIVGPWDNPIGHARWNGPNNASGTYFGDTQYVSFRDPQCYGGPVGGPDPLGANLQLNCTLQGLAQVVPAGTAGAFAIDNGRYALPLLQQPLPGKRGTLAAQTMWTVARWDFNANASKTFQIRESLRLQIRVDANNILNHPLLGDPSGLNGQASLVSTFGQITTKSGSRSFQGQLRLSF